MTSFDPLAALLLKFERASDTASPLRNINTPVNQNNAVHPRTYHENVASSSNEVVRDSNEDPVPIATSCPMMLRRNSARNKNKWTGPINTVPLPLIKRKKVKKEPPPTPNPNIATTSRFDPFDAIREKNRPRQSSFAVRDEGCRRSNKTFSGQRPTTPLDALLLKFEGSPDSAASLPIGSTRVNQNNVAPQGMPLGNVTCATEVVPEFNENMFPTTSSCPIVLRRDIKRSESTLPAQPSIYRRPTPYPLNRRQGTVKDESPSTPVENISRPPTRFDPFATIRDNVQHQSTFPILAERHQSSNKTFSVERPTTSSVRESPAASSLDPRATVRKSKQHPSPLAHSTPRNRQKDVRMVEHRVEFQLRQSEIPQDLHLATIEMTKHLFF